MPYYHATTKDRVDSIRKHGLGGLAGAPKAYPTCEDGVYLASDPMMAVGFLLERAMSLEFKHLSPREALRQFVVVVIDDSRVDTRRLIRDPNIILEGFWIHKGPIDVTAMPIIQAEDIDPPRPRKP